MDNVFNLHRTGLLIRRYFAERGRSELVYWGIMAIIFMLIRNTQFLIAALILIGGTLYAARFFRDLHSPTKGISELMLPATHLEKLIVALFFCMVYYFALMVACYAVGNIVGSFIYKHFLADTFFGSISYSMDAVRTGIENTHATRWVLFEPLQRLLSHFIYGVYFIFLLGQSIYLLGSVWFRRNQFFKTFIACFVLMVALNIVASAGRHAFAGAAPTMINYTGAVSLFKIALCITIPALWVITYVRLTEKQV